MAILKINDNVKELLQNYEQCRDSDMYLYGKYISIYYNELRNVLLAIAMQNSKRYKLPSYESVSRARRKLQENIPELRASEKAEKARYEQQIEIVDYVRGNNGCL